MPDQESDPNAPAISTEPFTCPRRMESGMQTDDSPLVGAGSGRDSWEDAGMSKLGLHCSYCGSLHPDTFMDALAAGATLVPTDKNYKAYVRRDEQEDKFYFPHLSDEQKGKLLEMVNGHAIAFGHPGYFYVLPYFTRRRPAL